jgi:hypothetical protein
VEEVENVVDGSRDSFFIGGRIKAFAKILPHLPDLDERGNIWVNGNHFKYRINYCYIAGLDSGHGIKDILSICQYEHEPAPRILYHSLSSMPQHVPDSGLDINHLADLEKLIKRYCPGEASRLLYEPNGLKCINCTFAHRQIYHFDYNHCALLDQQKKTTPITSQKQCRYSFIDFYRQISLLPPDLCETCHAQQGQERFVENEHVGDFCQECWVNMREELRAQKLQDWAHNWDHRNDYHFIPW